MNHHQLAREASVEARELAYLREKYQQIREAAQELLAALSASREGKYGPFYFSPQLAEAERRLARLLDKVSMFTEWR
ncbi:MAG: hypothetical protein ONB52_21960 [candidate division KSB1 bacterium]|nr:hypothetical protein [candidate division KSB1 bacterium]